VVTRDSIGIADKVRTPGRSKEEPGSERLQLACSFYLPWRFPIFVRPRRDSSCRQASGERPSRHTHRRAGWKKFFTIR